MSTKTLPPQAQPPSTGKDVAIELKNIVKSFGSGTNRIEVLHGINLTLPKGEMIFLVGPSGCGKTTLISIAAGILSADKGSEISLFGSDLSTLSNNQRSTFRVETVGFIFQQFNLVNTLTLAENVAIPLLIQGQPDDQALAKATELLNKVGLGQKVNSFPNALSGGQQQRVAIARSLANSPKLVICDEPTASLDSETGRQVMGLLKEIASADDRCVIVVTHDNRIYDYADRMVFMEDGNLQQTLTGNALKRHLNLPLSQGEVTQQETPPPHED